MTGVRAEVEVSEPGSCPVASVSESVEGSVGSVSWTASDDAVTEEFTVETDDDSLDSADVERVFDYGSESVYQFQRDGGDCVCEVVESVDCPIADVRAERGSLVLTLHLDEMADLRTLVSTLREQFGGVGVRYLAQASAEAAEGSDLVPVDRGRLTDRQEEVLRTAHEMGYFEYPRDSNATEVAAALDIRPSTFTEHLSAAQSKLLDDLLAD
ncbi:helix-turn-helix domain-containing protein [Salinirubrum litoreum]|uniref:Helix-turn-helix domain-containing protein n=1 Tax=Salinirubrum litoreum TaxID=1126234 RepID=A0ABD5RAA4_9EURY|nr:helix-turn-helix domain-containing protein [Salinirubrum litoreum]